MKRTTSSIQLSKSALQNNVEFIQNLIGKDVKFSSVVKGNAYGHGIEAMIPLLEDLGVDHFSVFSADEAYRVRKSSSGCEILIMGMISDDELKWAIEEEIDFYVFDLERLKGALKAAKEANKKAKIHLELETGMNRTGLNKKHLDQALELITENRDRFEINGVCTHYAGAESIANHYRVQKQYERFNRMCKRIEKKGIKPKYRHTACSAASVTYSKMRMDMVRIGILQYGFWPSQETMIQYLAKKKGAKRKDPLKRVITWKSEIMVTKKVEEGEFVGYGTSFIAPDRMRIGVVPVGYSHGYARSLSNQGRVLVNGERTAVIGIVNMNMLVIDLVDIPDAKRGDTVILIGEQGDLEITVSSFSEMINQLNYELLSRLPNYIPREVVK